MVKRVKETDGPRPLPTPEEIAEAIQFYLDGNWSWRDLQKASGVNHRVLRKMMQPDDYNVWYRSAEAFWKFHVESTSAA